MSVLSTGELEALLAEDVPYGDLTTDALGIGARQGSIRFAARGAMTVAGIEEAAALLRLAGADARPVVRSGDRAEAGATLLEGEGSAQALHRAWKVAQTLVEIWSGVATATRALVDAARAARAGVVVACTRKNTPGTKAMAVAAVRAGGGAMHRLGLSETILVFPEHRIFRTDGDFAALIRDLRARAPEKKLVVEVTSVADGLVAAAAGFDAVQAEKFTPEMVGELAAQLRSAAHAALILAAGGINPANAADYVRAGADVLVSSWPYSARPADVAVRMTPAERA